MENILLLKKQLKWNLQSSLNCLPADLYTEIFFDTENNKIFYRPVWDNNSLKYFDYNNPIESTSWIEIVLSDSYKFYWSIPWSPYLIKQSILRTWVLRQDSDVSIFNFTNNTQVTLIEKIDWNKIDSKDAVVYKNWISCLNITKNGDSPEKEERNYFDINWTNITQLFKKEILKIYQKDNEYSRMTVDDLNKTNFSNYIQVVDSNPSWFTIVAKLDWQTEREFIINFSNWKINTIRENLKSSILKSIPIIWWKFIVTELWTKWKSYYSIIDVNWNDIYTSKNWKELRVLGIDLLKPTKEEDVFIYDGSDWKVKIFWIDNAWILSIKNNDVISSLNWQIKESEEKILKELFTTNWDIRFSRIRGWAFTISIFDSEADKVKHYQTYSSKMFKIDWTCIWEDIKSSYNIKPYLWIQGLWEKNERSIISYYNSENTLLFTSDDIKLPTGLASRQTQPKYGIDWMLQFIDSRTQRSFILNEKTIFDRYDILNKEIWWVNTPFLKINWKIFNKKHLK